MKILSRRKAIKSLAAGGAGLALTGLTGTSGVAAFEWQTPSTAPLPRAFRGQHQLKPLPFDPAKLKGLSERLIKSHWENNYGGAVKALNTVEQRLASMLQDKDLPAYVYGDLKREELVRTGSVVLHEIYFANLGGNGRAGGAVLDMLKKWFGSYEEWEMEFRLGDPRLQPTHARDAQLLVMGSHAQRADGTASSGARYVRACLPHGLWRGGREVR